MVNTPESGWFYFSGALSLGLCALLFFTLIAFMHFQKPVIRAIAVEEITVSLEMPVLLEPKVSQEEPAAVAQTGTPLGVKDIFGEINATLSRDDLLAKKSRPAPQVALAPKIELSGEVGQASRLPKKALELQAHAQVQTAASAAAESSATAVVSEAALRDRYLSDVHKRLASAWHPGHSDLGKMAQIQLRIFARGGIEYEIQTVQGDQPFVDRLTAALEKIKAQGV
ncbi:MAG: hypothetical protein AB7E49_05355 [Campylobacterales bacterium]